jgi:hypothetical protein
LYQFAILSLRCKPHSVQTSYVTVEPKRRRAPTSSQSGTALDTEMAGSTQQYQQPQQYAVPGDVTSTPAISEGGGRVSAGRELRRARIVITVKRTASYKQWLDDNPLQTITAEDEDDVDIEDDDVIDVGLADDPQQEL